MSIKMSKEKVKNTKYKMSPFVHAASIRAKYYREDRIAIIYGQEQINWRTFYTRIKKLANAFRSIGIKKQEKIAFIFHNSPQFLEVNFAAQLIGAVPVPVNYRYISSEIEYLVDNSDSVCLMLEEDSLDEVLKIKDKLKKVRKFIILGTKKVDGFLDYEELINTAKDKERKTPVYDNDLACIIYTGGTTGRSKGVMLSYKNVLSNQESVIAYLINALPKVNIESQKYADDEFARKIMSAFDVLSGFVQGFYSKPKNHEKISVLVTPEREKGAWIKPLTMAYREGKIKIMSGMPEPDQVDIMLIADVGEQFRDFANLLPYPHTRKGKIASTPKLLRRFLFGGIKMKGSFKLRMNLIGSFLKPDKRVLNNLIVPPMFHLASYAFVIMFYTYVSGALVMPASKSFSVEETLQLIEDSQPGWMFLVPAMYKQVLDYFEENPKHGYDLTSLNIGLSGASLLRAKYKRKLIKNFPNMLVFDAFGQTEMAPVATIKLDAVEDTVTDRSVGKVLQGIDIKIIDEEGNEVSEGVTGEVCYKSDSVMLGYYRDDEKTKEAIDDEGWLHSGDLGYTKNGELFTVERLKECINTGSEKVFPLEVEEVITDHPAVQEVCVIGVPDEKWGHIVRAVVVLKPGKKATEQEIIDWCGGKIASYKKPRSVIFKESFPMSAVGKVQRHKVREKYGFPEAK